MQLIKVGPEGMWAWTKVQQWEWKAGNRLERLKRTQGQTTWREGGWVLGGREVVKVTDRAAASPLANMKRQTGKPSLPAGRTGGQAELR